MTESRHVATGYRPLNAFFSNPDIVSTQDTKKTKTMTAMTTIPSENTNGVRIYNPYHIPTSPINQSTKIYHPHHTTHKKKEVIHSPEFRTETTVNNTSATAAEYDPDFPSTGALNYYAQSQYKGYESQPMGSVELHGHKFIRKHIPPSDPNIKCRIVQSKSAQKHDNLQSNNRMQEMISYKEHANKKRQIDTDNNNEFNLKRQHELDNLAASLKRNEQTRIQRSRENANAALVENPSVFKQWRAPAITHGQQIDISRPVLIIQNDAFHIIDSFDTIDSIEQKSNNETPFDAYDGDCWNCKHSWDGKWVGCPYMVKHKVILTEGFFCSWNCALAYAEQETRMNTPCFNAMNTPVKNLIWLIRREELKTKYGKFENIPPNEIFITAAPDFRITKKYGGQIPINRYREMHCFNVRTSCMPKRYKYAPEGIVAYIEDLNKPLNRFDKYMNTSTTPFGTGESSRKKAAKPKPKPNERCKIVDRIDEIQPNEKLVIHEFKYNAIDDRERQVARNNQLTDDQKTIEKKEQIKTSRVSAFVKKSRDKKAMEKILSTTKAGRQKKDPKVKKPVFNNMMDQISQRTARKRNAPDYITNDSSPMPLTAMAHHRDISKRITKRRKTDANLNIDRFFKPRSKSKAKVTTARA